ncbi:RHS repeat domain-containing protein [Victivallis sp. Marseille-Q1083]|uniref:RHS repeat domain-containing protein n=1 Tax=Victivallis sp. Marseille-Q1083 TaxID=2717288 RepID=UPI00158B4CB4|nr:RHS repeat-associated core domain-containing protein [Victivallis sp. Marseille-Q1083]
MTMEWNGENRQKAIYNATARLEFAYDYNGRRFSKKTYAKSGADWVLSSEKKFIYDGFKQIAEYNGTTLAQAYVWQPAGSGDFDVPLWMKAGSNVYTYVTDGNKNIRQLKTAAGTVVATYDYDPFGNVSATGSVSSNPWQFSSEFRDAETGLIYYNYRYYAPSIGRWISRDPIWENRQYEVSKFIYIFVYNNSINMLDSLGLLVKEVMCDCSDACIEAMEQAIDRQADTILRLIDAAESEDCLSIGEIKEKYNLAVIGSAMIGAVGSGNALHNCPKAILENIEHSAALTGYSLFFQISKFLWPFSETSFCFGRTWAFSEAVRSKLYVSSLQYHIDNCKEKNELSPLTLGNFSSEKNL